jgi:hypothetical protein
VVPSGEWDAGNRAGKIDAERIVCDTTEILRSATI